MQRSQGQSANDQGVWGHSVLGLPWLAVAAAPIVFAFATWTGSQPSSLLNWWLRIFGLPVSALELLFVVIAVWQGAGPLGLLLRQPRWIKAALLGLALICVLDAATVSPQPLVAITWSLIMVIHLLFGLSVAQLSQKLGHDEAIQIWRAIAIGACLYVAIVATIYLTMTNPTGFDWEHFRLGTNNIRHTGQYAVVGVCAALSLAIFGRGRPRIFFLAAACLCMTLAFWTGTRGVVFAVWAGVLVALVFAPMFRSLATAIQLGLVTLASGALAWFLPVPHTLLGLERIASSFQQSDLNGISSFRLELWDASLQLVIARPLFGYGPGQLWWLLPANPYDVMHPHNVILQSLLQWGVAGTIIFGVLAIHVMRCLWGRRANFDASDAPAILVAAALAVMAMHDGTLFFTYPIALFAFSLGWLFGHVRLQPNESRRGSSICN